MGKSCFGAESGSIIVLAGTLELVSDCMAVIGWPLSGVHSVPTVALVTVCEA
jgi:hypothetical protein